MRSTAGSALYQGLAIIFKGEFLQRPLTQALKLAWYHKRNGNSADAEHPEGTSKISDKNDNMSNFWPIEVYGWKFSGICPLKHLQIS